MAEVSGPARSARRAKGDVPQLVIDPDAVVLDPKKIIVKHTGGGGYFCLGFGPSAEFLRAIDEDDRFNEAIDNTAVALGKLGAPIALDPDPFLRRLGIAVALAKDYDPDQPRDDHGRWTSDGEGAAGGAAAAFVSRSVVEVPELVPALRTLATRLVGGPLSGAVAFFGTLFIPTNRSLISEGTVPDAPDLGYKFDQGAGSLTLTRTNADGSKEVLFSGNRGQDGLFRDKDGNVVGRYLGGNAVIVDTSAVPGYRTRSSAQPKLDEDEDEDASTRPAIPANDNSPKLCPDPEYDLPGWEERSTRSLSYQSQVTGLPEGVAFNLNGVSFDGCRETDGTMLEAKGPGFARHMDGQGGWDFYFTIKGLPKLERQMRQQSNAARGRMVEWHFAEKSVADYFRGYAEKRGLSNIIVIYEPARQP